MFAMLALSKIIQALFPLVSSLPCSLSQNDHESPRRMPGLMTGRKEAWSLQAKVTHQSWAYPNQWSYCISNCIIGEACQTASMAKMCWEKRKTIKTGTLQDDLNCLNYVTRMRQRQYEGMAEYSICCSEGGKLKYSYYKSGGKCSIIPNTERQQHL